MAKQKDVLFPKTGGDAHHDARVEAIIKRAQDRKHEKVPFDEALRRLVKTPPKPKRDSSRTSAHDSSESNGGQ